MRGTRRMVLLLAALAAACTGNASRDDASVGARRLLCDAPLSTALAPSAHPPHAGTLTAGIAWTGEGCALHADETRPDVLVAVLDLQGALGLGLVVAATNGWNIASSSLGSGPTTHLADVPRDTDVDLELEGGEARVWLTFRVEGETLTLLDMHR